MNARSLGAYLSARADDPAIRLLAETTSAMRADPGYLALEGDRAASAFLTEEAPVTLAGNALERVLARIEAAGALDERAATRAAAGDTVTAEIAALPSPVREAALRALERDHWRFGSFGLRRLPLDLGPNSLRADAHRAGHGRGRTRP